MGGNLVHNLVTLIINKLALFFFIRKINGIENLKLEGGFVIASNHVSYLDALMVTSAIENSIKRPVYYVGKGDIKYKNAVFKFFYTNYETISIGFKESKKDYLKQISKHLKNGRIVAIFPEGTRSQDGKLKKGKTGAIRLALECNVPIIPVGVSGTFRLWPKYKKYPRLKKSVDISIGQPFFPPPKRKNYNKKSLNMLTQKLMGKIEALID